MKKTAKSLLLISIMAIILLALTGCGGNKIVATAEDEDCKEKMEVSFKDDKIEEAVWNLTFEEKDDATDFVKIYESATEGIEEEIKGIEIEQKNKKVTVTMDSEVFCAIFEIDEDATKDEVKKALEDEDYEVK